MGCAANTLFFRRIFFKRIECVVFRLACMVDSLEACEILKGLSLMAILKVDFRAATRLLFSAKLDFAYRLAFGFRHCRDIPVQLLTTLNGRGW